MTYFGRQYDVHDAPQIVLQTAAIKADASMFEAAMTATSWVLQPSGQRTCEIAKVDLRSIQDR
jgi:hypothetical protein